MNHKNRRKDHQLSVMSKCRLEDQEFWTVKFSLSVSLEIFKRRYGEYAHTWRIDVIISTSEDPLTHAGAVKYVTTRVPFKTCFRVFHFRGAGRLPLINQRNEGTNVQKDDCMNRTHFRSVEFYSTQRKTVTQNK